MSPEELIHCIPSAVDSGIDYHVKRKYTSYETNPPRVYVEEVWSQADGNYFITSEEIFEIFYHGPEEEWIPIIREELDRYNNNLKWGQGYFAAKNRGFEIRDPYLFLENYNYFVLSASETYLDRLTLVVRITSKHLDRPNYTAWIDFETGLVLKYVEDTLTMNPLTVMEITELNLNPDFSGITFYDHDIHESEIQLKDATQLGFLVYQPLFIPQGFELDSVFEVTSYDRPELKLVYSDGIQEIVIKQTLLNSPNPSGLVPESTTNNIKLNITSYAGLTSTHFLLGNLHCAIRARIHEQELAAMIESFSIILATH